MAVRAAICYAGLLTRKLAIGAKINPDNARPCSHNGTKQSCIYQCLPLPPLCLVPEAQPQTCFAPCYNNELVSLLERHLCEHPQTDTTAQQAAYKQFLKLFPPPALTPSSPHEILRNKTPAKAKVYREAFDSLLHYEYTTKDTKVRAFVKKEKANETASAEQQSAPRMIQHQSPRACARLSTYLHPIEQHLFRRAKELYGESHHLFAKCDNSFARAERIRTMGNGFANPVWIMLDHSRFDAHQSVQWLSMEHDYYRKCHPGDLALEDLLKHQLVTHGSTRSGIAYTSVGGRSSGMYNTALGNSINNVVILEHVFRDVKHESYVDGDDSVVCIDKSDSDVIPKIPERCEEMGMSTKLEGATETLEEVTFCQCRPVELSPGKWRMVRTPSRVLSRGVHSVVSYRGTGWFRLLAAVGQCELACNSGVPVLQEFALYLTRHAQGHKPLKLTDYEEQRIAKEPTPRVRAVTGQARVSFSAAFGMNIATQLALEEHYRNADHSKYVLELVNHPTLGKHLHF